MKARVRLLRTMFILPVVIMCLRIGLTVLILIFNPLGMSLRYIQCVTLLSYLVTMFMYLKLYSDGDPVISVLLPSIVHFIVVLVFTKTIQWIPFVPLVTVDIVFLVVKGIKASLFPFDIESGVNGDDLSSFDEEELEEET